MRARVHRRAFEWVEFGVDIYAKPRLAELRKAGLFNIFGAVRWIRNEEWIDYFNGCLVKCVACVASFGLGFVLYRSIGKSQKILTRYAIAWYEHSRRS